MKSFQLINLTAEDFRDTILEGVKKELQDFKKELKEPEEILTRKQTCDLLQVNLSTLHNWRVKKKLTPYLLGNRVFYKRSEIMGQFVKHN